MNIYCLSEGELYNIENGKEHLVHCERVESYRDAVRKMKARDENHRQRRKVHGR